ncbi:DNA topoisomerase (ATP-hydrolyzing) subunit A [Mycoplasmoides genitalium]|uniref:DNA gyrase subunit A n=1 Tax=Mycoplasma genitalium (strain ATCC 33530 / DSM 19775 / NCTC 10195 / G37) TaxID=243273 RepID=GYRA_MYCGE|nr:DNA topoisomerase (ATP-hydrolyzing) subunit A [Mycoplasmoides genitalium]P47250.1 RecName: Full=DNA gyrase subunit A [Mycoplasmoides genitalium G37]AAC71220.1 DNA gyrase, A subunit [Mycoplasmoides genitalium G37]ABY79415.1 DNA gyrase, A subunit [synthetic Mycoplasma genitalium JCVI-1.0]AFQ03314.1 DNA gyrase subunit A [Mycoplasmoides genitalium M6282]
MAKQQDQVDKIRENLDNSTVKSISLANELERSFMEYAMSVIVARALPDARDGLKPVHRRVLYGAYIGGMHHDRPFKKSARIVGDVMSKFHPHGDMAIYDTMSRMAQDFSLRYLLIDGHGNFGSIDGDRPAAQRYTEARLSKLAAELLKDIDKDTVDFIANYDGEEKEPTVLPAAFPNLLANGSSGIAVGMSTSIPSHNLSELIAGLIMLIDNPQCTFQELLTVIKGPDFPTGANIIYTKGIESYFETGKGNVVIRSKVEIEQLQTRSALVVTEIPYMVNKTTLIEKIVELVKAEEISGIADIRDESSREGIRLVIEVKRDTVPEVLLNQLFKSTRLQVRFPVNMLALVKGAPVLLNMKQALEVYLDHQIDVLVRKTKFVLNKQQERYHILSGLLIAALNIDEVVAIIKKSANNQEAINTLNTKFKLDEIQAKAVLDMRLRSLSVLEVNKLQTEQKELKDSIEFCKKVLADQKLQLKIIKEELQKINDQFGDERRSEILYDISEEIDDESLIKVENVVITMSTNGYLKRIGVDAYNLQHRGGVGVKGLTTYVDDSISQLLVCSTHSDLLFFTDKGKVYRIRAHQIPYGFRTNKGIPAVNLIKIEKDERICSLLSVNNYDDGYFFFCTKNGIVKRTSLNEFINILSNGKRAISFDDNDTLYSVIKTHGNDEIFIGSTNGFVVRFHENQLRVLSRTARGVFGISLNKGEFVNGLSTSSNGSLLLSVGQNGIGKLTSIDKYRLTKRNAKGVKTLRVTDRTGPVVTTTTVFGNEDLLMISSAGKIVRTSLQELSEQGKNTSGVKLIRLKDNERLERVTIFKEELEDKEMQLEDVGSKQITQ